MTFVIIPQGQGDLSTRSFEVSYRRLRIAAVLLALAAAVWLGMAASWWYVAAQAARVPALRREVAALQQDRIRVEQLARVLARMERQYNQVRTMLGAGADSTGGSAGTTEAGDSVGTWIPAAWPLASRGFVTRPYSGPAKGRHPGIDIAVATGTPIRAVAAGTVLATGEDRVYGRFLRIAHPGGYESLYAHASRLLVSRGEHVDDRQDVALSGSSGRSSAPHLHFEIRRRGTPVNPAPLLPPPG